MKDYFYPLALSSWTNEEVDKACDVIRSQMTTMGRHVDLFQKDFSEYLGCSSSYMVNSGSSANLLMASALKLYLDLYGDARKTILIPAVGWSTSYAPFIQLGFNVKVVDVSLSTFNLDQDTLLNAIDDDVVAVLAINILGNPCPLADLKVVCDDSNVFLLEDNCESLGAEIDTASGPKKAGSFGLMSTHSFFFSHHINTMEGGCVSTSSKEFSLLLKVIRNHGWARDIQESDTFCEGNSPVFDWFASCMQGLRDDEVDFQFMKSFYFLLPGFNLRPTEVQGALGVLQLKKLSNFIDQRRKNASLMKELVSGFDQMTLQSEFGRSSYFGFGFVLDEACRRDELASFLDSEGVQVRPIVSGSIAMHPLAKFMSCLSNYDAADSIHCRGFFVGNHHVDFSEKITKFSSIMHDYLAKI